MLLMALDHARVYAGIPAGGPTPGIFFTRWVTNFCAPVFFFLAGVSVFLTGERLGNVRDLSRHLVWRGAGLVLLELTVIRFAWTFNFDYAHYLLAGVIWAFGWCMILMAGLIHLPRKAVAMIGLGILVGHNLFDLAAPWISTGIRTAWPLNILYYAFTSGAFVPLSKGGPALVVLYSILPWIGVMAAGHAFAPVLRAAPEARRRICLALGLTAVGAFILLRATGGYGDPHPWAAPRTWFGFLNATKYPASLQFLLMTLGLPLLLIPLLEGARGAAARVVATFGKAPLLFYLLHIPVIHATALLISWVRLGNISPWLFANHPMMAPNPPASYPWSLGLLYAVTACVCALLYLPCRWAAARKSGEASSPGLAAKAAALSASLPTGEAPVE